MTAPAAHVRAAQPGAVAAPARRHWMPYAMVLPLAVFFAFTFLAPFAVLLLTSLRSYNPLEPLGDIQGIQQYRSFLTGPGQWAVIRRTLRITAATTSICLLLAYPTALICARASRRTRRLIVLAVLAPLLTSVIARTFGWWTVLAPSTTGNLIGRVLGFDGAVLFTETAAVIGLVNVLLPYMFLSVLASVQNIDPDLHRAARSLGASRWAELWRVDVPLTVPGIIGGVLLVTSLSLSSFITPSLLGGSRSEVVAQQVYRFGYVYFNRPLSAAGAVLLLTVATVLVAVNVRVLGRSAVRQVGL